MEKRIDDLQASDQISRPHNLCPDYDRARLCEACWNASWTNFCGPFGPLRGQIFRFCSRCRNGVNPPFSKDSSPMKRLEPLDHIEMRAFLRAFAKTTSLMWLIYHIKINRIRVLFWAPFSFGEEGSKNRRKRRFFLCLSQVEPLSIRWPAHPAQTKTPPGP